MRVSDATHRIITVLAGYYDRFIPYIYSALINDRLAILLTRTAEEFEGKQPRSELVEVVKKLLRIEIPKELLDEIALRRTLKGKED